MAQAPASLTGLRAVLGAFHAVPRLVGGGDRLGSGNLEGSAGPAEIPLGWRAIDAALPDGGLRRSAIHDWCRISAGAADTPAPRRPPAGARGGAWSAPLGVLAHIARCSATGDRPCIVWIGRRCWPCAQALARRSADRPDLAACSLFVDPTDAGSRVWAADLALRCRGVAAAVIDGSGFDLVATRRLQLAAQAGATVGLVARPEWERSVASASHSRWWVRPEPGMEADAPRWRVELRRCRGAASAGDGAIAACVVELCDATGDVNLVAEAGDRPAAAPAGAGIGDGGARGAGARRTA